MFIYLFKFQLHAGKDFSKKKNHVIFLQPFGYCLNMVILKFPHILANLAHSFHKNPLHELQIGFFGSPNGKRLPKKIDGNLQMCGMKKKRMTCSNLGKIKKSFRILATTMRGIQLIQILL